MVAWHLQQAMNQPRSITILRISLRNTHTHDTEELAHLHFYRSKRASLAAALFQHRFGDYHQPTGVLYPSLLGLTSLSSVQPLDIRPSQHSDGLHQFLAFWRHRHVGEFVHFCSMLYGVFCYWRKRHRNDQNDLLTGVFGTTSEKNTERRIWTTGQHAGGTEGRGSKASRSIARSTTGI